MALLVAACATAPQFAEPPTSPDVVAVVNGTAIDRQAFDDYLKVFTDPGGVVAITPAEVLISLINQQLVHYEAVRRGLQADVAAVEAALNQPHGALEAIKQRELARTNSVEPLKRRVAAFLEMSAVRDAVLSELPAAEAGTPSPSDLTGSLHQQELWSNWLAQQRSCATITVHDSSMRVASSSPRPHCSS